MQNKLINILRIFFILILLVLGLLTAFRPAGTETNILKALFSDSENVLVDLSTRFSSKINVIVESSSSEKSEEISKTFYSKVDKDKIHIVNADILNILNTYEKYSDNLLSSRTHYLLVSKQYEKVEENSLESLYNPTMQPIGSIEDDPFLFLTDFVMNLSENGGNSDFTPFEYEGKYYSLVMLTVNDDVALSPTVVNDEIRMLKDIAEELSTDDVRVYLTGAPVHSYYASNRSIFEINFICILSTLFIIGLVFWYFNSLLPLIPIAISIGIGIFTGYAVTSLFFRDIHILTFVFSTTLIGICVDYLLHYFVSYRGKDTIKEIFKSLSVSLLTTVSAFAILFFANFILLKQISVFTITGLVTVYSIVVLFLPLFNFKNFENKRSFKSLKISKKMRNIILCSVFVIALFGLVRTKFDDNIKNMYVPPKFLINAEKLFGELVQSNGDLSIFVVKGDNIQDILQKEEKITDKLTEQGIDFQSLSKYVPSEKRQKENRDLKRDLYTVKLNEYAEFLPPAQPQKLIKKSYGNQFLTLGDDFVFLKNNFLIDENTSIIIAYNYNGNEIDGVKAVNFQKDISAQIRKYRLICLSLLIPIFGFLYILLAKIYDYKSALVITLPSLCAVIFVIGLLGLFGFSINLFHVLAIFLIIGFGLDYSVFRFAGAEKFADAVLMSCLTSVFLFTLLAFAGFKLISSLGTVLALGLLSSYLFSIMLIDKKDNFEVNND